MVYEAAAENNRGAVRMRRVALGGIYNHVEVLPGGSEVRPGARIVLSTAKRLADGTTLCNSKGNSTIVATRWEAN